MEMREVGNDTSSSSRAGHHKYWHFAFVFLIVVIIVGVGLLLSCCGRGNQPLEITLVTPTPSAAAIVDCKTLAMLAICVMGMVNDRMYWMKARMSSLPKSRGRTGNLWLLIKSNRTLN